MGDSYKFFSRILGALSALFFLNFGTWNLYFSENADLFEIHEDDWKQLSLGFHKNM